jgi:hypothetical protein
MKSLLGILFFNFFLVANLNSNLEILQGQKSISKNCGKFVSFTNYSSSSLTITFHAENYPIQTVTVSPNSNLYVGNFVSSIGSWTFRIQGGLNGSIASDIGGSITECINTSSDERFYVLQNPLPGHCGYSGTFLFADYTMCN